jgi:HAE1 family hydrophobic/amphiphilic exporter-1
MTLAELSVKRSVFAVMLVGFLVVLGIFSFRELGVDLFPRADAATVNINVRLPGATPEEMTTQVVMPLEEALSTISGLDELTAMTFDGSTRIVCKFVLEREIESAAQDVREKVAGALRNLPPNILPPVIQKADPDADPVLSVVVASSRSLRETSEIADKQIKRALETIDGVGEVSLTGARVRQIRILVDADRLNAQGLTVNQFQRAIQEENVEVPGGRIIRGESELGVRTLGRIDAVSQFGELIVANVDGAPIRVNDLGRVEDGFARPDTWNVLDGKEAVTLEVRRQSGTNTVEIIAAVKKRLDEIAPTLPSGVTLQILRDQSVFINASIASLQEHLLFGSVLASLIVLLFIRSFRSVLIASVAIPASIIATFTLIKVMGFTLNNMTLLALTLAVGIVIDDAIVVLENIVRFIDQKGLPPARAAIEATQEITLAVLATTISLVIIFLPIAFMQGYARRYVNEFGWTMAFSILVSMLVSFTLTPMLSSRLLKRRGAAECDGSSHEESESMEGGILGRLSRSYVRLLTWSLDHRAAVLAVAAGTFLLAFPLNMLVGRDWIPPDDQSELSLSLNLPEGTSLDATAQLTREIGDRIAAIPGVEFTNPYIHGGLSSHSHIYVRLSDVGDRDLSNLEMADEFRKITGEYRNLRSKVMIPSALGGGESWFPVQVRILGPDFNQVVQVAKDVATRIREIPGLLDVEPAVSVNSPELQVKIDRQRASDLGVRAGDVARAVRLMIAGEDQISVYKEGDEQYDVTMQLLPEQQNDIEVLRRLMVPSTQVGQVRLDSIASVERGLGPARIERFNRQFQISVNANNSAELPLDVAAQSVRQKIQEQGLPRGFGYRFTGAVKILDETTTNLILAFLLASIFMYMVLAAQFDSFVHPFTIMLSLPLAIPFALLSLWLSGRTLNLWSALGVLLLLGIVKKNGILQIDYTNKLRAQGLPVREAILRANRVRLRPILMTTFAIVAGLVPTALGIGAGSAQRSAVALTIIGGQMLCLLPTLIVTPVAYAVFAELNAGELARKAQGLVRSIRPSLARRFTFFG